MNSKAIQPERRYSKHEPFFNVAQMPGEEALLSKLSRCSPGLRKASGQLVKEKAANLAGETRQQRRLKRI